MPKNDAAASRSTAAREASRARQYSNFNVVLLDDNRHSYPYVVEMLGRLFGFSRQKAWAIAHKVDTDGRAVIETTTYERAEFKQQQIHEYGPDWRIDHPAGSMEAVVERIVK